MREDVRVAASLPRAQSKTTMFDDLDEDAHILDDISVGIDSLVGTLFRCREMQTTIG